MNKAAPKQPLEIPDLGFSDEENHRMDGISNRTKRPKMVFDTNLIIKHIRRQEQLPALAIIPMVVAGELEAFTLKADWGYQKVTFLQGILNY